MGRGLNLQGPFSAVLWAFLAKFWRASRSAVKMITHYRYRGAKLRPFSYIEWRCLVKIVECEKKGAERGGARGSAPMARFPFDPAHPLSGSWEQQLRRKIPVPILSGPAPPRLPANLDERSTSRVWSNALERFYCFVAANYIPWADRADTTITPRPDLIEAHPSPNATWPIHFDAVKHFLNHLDSVVHSNNATADERLLAEGRLQAIENLAHGLSVCGSHDTYTVHTRGHRQEMSENECTCVRTTLESDTGRGAELP